MYIIYMLFLQSVVVTIVFFSGEVVVIRPRDVVH